MIHDLGEGGVLRDDYCLTKRGAENEVWRLSRLHPHLKVTVKKRGILYHVRLWNLPPEAEVGEDW